MNRSSRKLTRLASAAGLLVMFAAFLTAAALAAAGRPSSSDCRESALPSEQLDLAIAAPAVAPAPFDMRSPDTRDARSRPVPSCRPRSTALARHPRCGSSCRRPTRRSTRPSPPRSRVPAEARPRPSGAGRPVEGLRLGHVRRDRRCGPGRDRSARRWSASAHCRVIATPRRPARSVPPSAHSFGRRGGRCAGGRDSRTPGAPARFGVGAGRAAAAAITPRPAACSASYAFAMRFCARVSHASTTISSSSSGSSRSSEGMRTSTAGYPLK